MFLLLLYASALTDGSANMNRFDMIMWALVLLAAVMVLVFGALWYAE
jgi:hypothetical protein